MTDRQLLRLIGQNVRAARHQANLTQECLAELAGVHWQTISNIERGKFPFPVTTFARISQALATSPNRLLDGLAEPDLAHIESVKKALARKRRPRSR
ncbi:MAG: helix-turn-helix domain-containing protein [Limisphaerales bacterium]